MVSMRIAVAALALNSALAFHQGMPAFKPASLSSAPSSSKTALFISSWGKGEKSATLYGNNVNRENPADNVQAYLPPPPAVEARNSVDDSCLVSGLVKTQARTDQTMFDLLNHEDSAFEFTKIVAFVDDTVFAKKRLLSRSARYTGLLDKLEFVQATSPGSLPTVEQMENVKNWVAYLEADPENPSAVLEQIQKVASIARQAPALRNVAILITNALELDINGSAHAMESLKAMAEENDKKAYTVVVVGKIEEHAEGSKAYQINEFATMNGTLASEAVFSRDESLRMVTELLQLECGSNRAVTVSEVYNKNMTETKLVKGLRQAGYARPQEIDHMMREGVDGYQKAIDEFLEKNPDYEKGYTTDVWWETEAFQKSVRKRRKKEAEEEIRIKDARQEEVEKIAKEWVKREFFRQSMADATTLSEEEFTKEVWERALLEGDLKYRQMNGEIVDTETELADFKAQQERKKETMLKRAKDELQEVLSSENLGPVEPPRNDDED